MTLQEWLGSNEPIVLTPSQATITGKLIHRSNGKSWERPGADGYRGPRNSLFEPRVYAHYDYYPSYNYNEITHEEGVEYKIEDNYIVERDGSWRYRFTLTIPKKYLEEYSYIGLSYGRRTPPDQTFYDYGTYGYKSWNDIWTSTDFYWDDPNRFW